MTVPDSSSVYANFGYSLPRVADAQSVYGMQIPVSSAQPGDLIFYARNGYVYHVSMYIGGGQVVHAAGTPVRHHHFRYQRKRGMGDEADRGIRQNAGKMKEKGSRKLIAV